MMPAPMGVRLLRGPMRLLNRCDGLGKKTSRPPDHGRSGFRGIFRQDERDQCLLVNLRQVQRLQISSHRLPAEFFGRRGAGRRTGLDVSAQDRHIVAG